MNVTKPLISSQVPMALVFNATLLILLPLDFIITDATVLQTPFIMKIMAPVSVKMDMSKMLIYANLAKALLYAHLIRC